MSLIAHLAEDEWAYLPGFQGRRTNLLVGLSFHDGELVTLAQWTRHVGPTNPAPGDVVREDLFCFGYGSFGAGMVLTLSKVAVQAGEA